MLTIRREQFDEIGRRLAFRWEDTMVLHLETFFPERTAELGERGVREAIVLGQKKAAKYDIYTERDICKYLNFMFAFGFDFDTDPELPWAKQILTNPLYTRPNLKLHMLEKAADGDFEPDAELVIPPTEEEIEEMRREREAAEAVREAEMKRVLEADRIEAEARGAELARQIKESGGQLDLGDGNGNTGDKQ
ncbi:MAG TPA: hypothetical protein PK156_12140 [Polyangium sp.]|nr:hypothetical protein [Polyangium sp.]